MSKILNQVRMLISTFLVSVYGEKFFISGVAHWNEKENGVDVQFFSSNSPYRTMYHCIGFCRDTNINLVQEEVDKFVEEKIKIHGDYIAETYFEIVKADRDGEELLDACQALEYSMNLGSEDGVNEEIKTVITVPLHPRLAELVDRSAIREFYGEYNEGDETITLVGETVHGM